MKRDMDVIRTILLNMEGSNHAAFTYEETIELSGLDDPDIVIEHVVLLNSGGYLESSQRGIYRISWQGHEFLEAIRDPEIWRKTKEGAGKVGSWSVKLLADMAMGIARAKAAELGLPII